MCLFFKQTSGRAHWGSVKLARMHLLSAGYASALLLIALLSQGKLLSHRAGGCGAGSRRYEGKVPYLQHAGASKTSARAYRSHSRGEKETGMWVFRSYKLVACSTVLCSSMWFTRLLTPTLRKETKWASYKPQTSWPPLSIVLNSEQLKYVICLKKKKITK